MPTSPGLYYTASSLSDLPAEVRDSLNAKLQARRADGLAREPMAAEGDAQHDDTLAVHPLIDELNRWDVQAHQYENKSEAKAGFLGIGGIKAKTLEAGVVQEAKRFLVEKSDDGLAFEFGVAVRLWVAVSSGAIQGDLTLPSVAAKAELKQARAEIGIAVAGYRGPLGDLLPAPETLSVENLTVYTNAFKRIQALVLGPQGLEFLAPTVLGYQSKVEEPPPANA